MGVDSQDPGKIQGVNTLDADLAAAVRRHPSARHKDDATIARVVGVIWQQLSLFADYPDDEPMRLRRPRSARQVRALRELLAG
jgi:hypothetical protein